MSFSYRKSFALKHKERLPGGKVLKELGAEE